MNRAEKTTDIRPIRPGEHTTGGAPEGYLMELAKKGVQLHRAGRPRDAENIYHQILQIDPGHADANNLLGVLASGAGNAALAIESIAKALARAPDMPIYHFNLASVFHRLGRLAETIDCCRKAVALQPDFAEAHFGLATAFKGLGRMEDACTSYRRVLSLEPDTVEAHNDLGFALHELGRTDDAVGCFHRALAIDPNYAPAHGNLARACLKMGRAEEALARNHQALALDPNLIESHNNMGNALRELGRFGDAVASYDRAIALKPDYAEAHGNRGNALQVMGRFEAAVEACRTAIAIKPDKAVFHGNLGTVFQKLGKLEEAFASYRQAIALEPDYAAAWNNLGPAIKAAQYADGRMLDCQDRFLAGLGAAARASGEFAMLDYYLAAFRPHLAEDGFHEAMAGLPPREHEAVIIDEPWDDPSDGPPDLPDKLIALLHFGRSGTGLLHSLIDDHAEISTLPSIYLRGYFNPGVWKKLSAGGWRELPDRFADMFEVLFDAASPKITPGTLEEKNAHLGVKEGMTALGDNRDESLTLDRETFCAEARGLMRGLGAVDAMSFLQIVHAAYEITRGGDGRKQTIFYHIHNPENFAKLNFLRHAPHARLVMMIREPIQSLESWIRAPFADNDYTRVADSIAKMLFAIDEVAFRARESVGVRLEDLKSRPEATLGALCAWMGVEDDPCLYGMTAQGKKWWGDPSSPDYAKDRDQSPFDDASVKRPVGSIFSESDQLVLGALFYPFSVKFGYREPDRAGFERDLKAIRPLLGEMMDFEKAMAQRANRDHEAFMAGGPYRLLRASLLERWAVLDEFGDYPHMLTPLDLSGS